MAFLSRASRALARPASLLAVSLGGLLLVGDSTECPDGYASFSYEATFTSTCPADFAPASGKLTINVPADGNSQSQLDLVKAAMVSAGFDVDSVDDVGQGRSSSNLCVTHGVTFARGGDSELTCTLLEFDRQSQTVSCSSASTTAPVLGSASSSSSPSSSGVGSGSGGPSAEGGGGSATEPRGSGAADGAGGHAPAVTSCAITFTKTH